MDFPPRSPRQGPTDRRAPPERSPRRGGSARPPRRPPAETPPRPRRRRPTRETMARIGVAVPWILLAVFIIAVGGIPFALAMIGFAVIGLGELFRMTRRFRPMIPVGFAAAAAMVVAAYYGTQFQIVLVGVAVF